MTDLEIMFEKMLENKFPAIAVENRKQYPMVDIVENLLGSFCCWV